MRLGSRRGGARERFGFVLLQLFRRPDLVLNIRNELPKFFPVWPTARHIKGNQSMLVYELIEFDGLPCGGRKRKPSK